MTKHNLTFKQMEQRIIYRKHLRRFFTIEQSDQILDLAQTLQEAKEYLPGVAIWRSIKQLNLDSDRTLFQKFMNWLYTY